MNGVEITIADNPENKPVTIAIKPKNGLTGKANLKIYAKNRRGSANIMVTKVRGGNTVDVKHLAFKVVIISGKINIEDIDNMRRQKTSGKQEKSKSEIRCDKCDKIFNSKQEIEIHMKATHNNTYVCGLCSIVLKDEEELKKHKQATHSEVKSPDPKKIKIKEGKYYDKSNEEMDEMMDIDDECIIRSNMKDEKVLKMQQRFDEEDKRLKDMKKKKRDSSKGRGK